MIKVSVVVAVYNHEKYIEQALYSIMAQKTNFDFEVLIGEDCSTDNTRTILKNIEKKCPSNFQFFYRDENYGSEKNFNDLYERMQGEYFIVLEGDDYWTYEYKLQKQFDFLEKHKDYIACSHNVQVVNDKSEVVQMDYQECKDSEYTIEHFRCGLLPGQTASLFIRNYYKNNLIDYSLQKIPFLAGDMRKAFMLVLQGKIYCIQEKWSCYRFVQNSGSSFSATHKKNIKNLENALNFYFEMIKFAKKLHNSQGILAAEELYFLTLASKIKIEKEKDDLKIFIKRFFCCKNKRYIVKYILKKGDIK